MVVGGASRPRAARGGWLVARRRRRTAGRGEARRRRRHGPAQHLRSPPPPGVCRRHGRGAARPARVPAVSVGRGRDAAIRRLVLVRRHQQRFSDVGGAGPARVEHGTLGHPLLGHRRGRILSPGARDRRALRALVSVRRIQPDLPLARLGVARARAVGPWPGGGGDLPPLRRAAVSSAAVHLHAGLASPHARSAAHASARAELSARSEGVDARPRVSVG